MIIYITNKHTLKIDDFSFKCCIGKGGISKEKKEGDKKTPFGSYHIEHLYFRKDKVIKPLTKLKCIEIKKKAIPRNKCLISVKVIKRICIIILAVK